MERDADGTGAEAEVVALAIAVAGSVRCVRAINAEAKGVISAEIGRERDFRRDDERDQRLKAERDNAQPNGDGPTLLLPDLHDPPNLVCAISLKTTVG